MLIIHGLLGSGRNWQSVAQSLAEHHQVAVPDLRNHGASPHADAMDYPAMARDVEALLDRLQWPRAHVIGHSMGGKVAMYLAMSRPERVASLLVADIAPSHYPDRHSPYLDAMETLPLATLRNRAQADTHLAASIPQAAVRLFLLQNLVADNGGYRWRANLAA
ncbi:alpha/beta fold hydrolase, partial [Methylogaea oryzae]|uniref:alpha/beta fold hydrolase n=1 Tax=Methylogaea oryzae TaxID=1295382 RepID=UPI00138F5721